MSWRFLGLLPLSILLPLLLAILISILLTPKYEEFHCDHSNSLTSSKTLLSEECYIPSDYYDAKLRFQSLAKKCNAEMYSLSVVESLNLTIDVAILRGSKEKYLIHFSGTHGVEAYSGSAIQAAYLHSLCFENKNPYPSDIQPTIIFVHSVNPYGFQFHRRVNEENIDLNRNFLTPEQFEEVLNRDPNHAGYESLRDAFNPPYPPLSPPILNDLHGIWNTLRVLITVGFNSVKGALVTGTYHSSKGLSYGGKSLSKSGTLLQEFFNRPDIGIQAATKYAFIDVHTGLGPPGVDTLMLHDEAPGCKDRTEKYFPTELSSSTPIKPIGGIKPWLYGDAKDVEKGYEKTLGFTTNYFCDRMRPNFNPASRICFTQEFGTYSPLLVAKGFVDENQAYHYGNDEQKLFYGHRLRSLFFIHTKEWATSIVRRGKLVITQALEYLRED